jgi:hypothetical protein
MRIFIGAPSKLSQPTPVQVVNVRDARLPDAGGLLPLLPEARVAADGLAANRSRQFHARLAFKVSPPAGGTFNFTSAARLLTGGGSHVDILLQGATAVTGQEGAVISSLRVAVDKRNTGGFTPQVEEGGPVPLPIKDDNRAVSGWQLPATQLMLDMFVDHSLVEVYAMDGLARVTSRIYPADESVSWGLAAYGSAGPGATVSLAAADVWAMDNAWAGQAPLC